MYRLGEIQDSMYPDEIHTLPDEEEELKTEALQRDINTYFQTQNAHLPVIGFARCFGLLPACLKYPLAVQLGVEKDITDFWHRVAHVLGWSYALLMWLLMTGLTVLMLVYLIGAKFDKGILSVFWISFEVITWTQVSILMIIFLACSSDFGWLMSSVDFFMISFDRVSFLRTDIAEMLVKEKQNRVDDEIRYPGAISSGVMNMSDDIQVAANAIFSHDTSIRQRKRSAHSRNGEKAAEEHEAEAIEFGELYLRKVRMWTLLVTVIFVTILLTFLAFIIYNRIVDFIIPLYHNMYASAPKPFALISPKIVPVLSISWMLLCITGQNWPMTATISALVFECFNIIYQSFPILFFISNFLTITTILDEFNDRVRVARESYLEIDRTIVYHQRVKTLIKRMEKCLGGLVFFILAGDFFCVASGTFLGFWRTCDWKNLEGICLCYLLRHALMMIRLIVIGTCGAILQLKLNFTLQLLDGYMSKSILNTERLKIMGLISQSGDNAFTVWNFFSLTRPFFISLVAGSVAYTALVIRVTEKS